MRLFIAINFDGTVKKRLQEIINELEKHSIQGRFVSQEHLHLTLEFLGEISDERIVTIKNVMDKLDFKPFILKPSKIGYFKRPQGNIYWLGIEDNEALMSTQETLHKLLIDQGFILEKRPYKPHITLGRKVKLKNSFNSNIVDEMVKAIKIDVNRIELMKSENINGKLVYSVIYSRIID
ncbi:MAG: RNA 2',3'-cyclic phosphodiesterase [Tissierellia bacterium]|nr:RNA 2',3'-cyclic phosphodiesterase [Tissierellia bacterium]